MRLLLWTAALILGIVLTIFGERLMSTRGELLLDSYHLDGCRQKHCSNQIELGTTSWQQATASFGSDLNSQAAFNCWYTQPWWEDCIYSDNYSNVGVFGLNLKEARVRVGDVINRLGDPVVVHRCREDLSTSLIFKGNVLIELAAVSPDQFDPAASVGRIEYYSQDIPDAWARSYWQAWHGFSTRASCSN